MERAAGQHQIAKNPEQWAACRQRQPARDLPWSVLTAEPEVDDVGTGEGPSLGADQPGDGEQREHRHGGAAATALNQNGR